jgi:protein-S-isoprenylcysteine O-methyltransferase Ste14
MFDVGIVRVLSILMEIGTIGSVAVLSFFTWERGDLGEVKASRPASFALYQLWLFLVLVLPIIFYLVGAILPGWVYGTFLNVSFNGAEYLQIISIPIFLIGAILADWSEWAIGQFMRPHTEVMEKHQLVTRGPYSRSIETSNVHRCHTNCLGIRSSIPSRNSSHSLSCLFRHSVQEGYSGRTAAGF